MIKIIIQDYESKVIQYYMEKVKVGEKDTDKEKPWYPPNKLLIH